MEDIKITLETLYDILRNEKKREDLQKLENSFFMDVVGYLREKKILFDSKQESNELFAAGERDKLEYELRSIKRILKEIYEKREKKIIDIALNRSRTGSDIIDTSSMLREEKDFYERLLIHLNTYRKSVLANLLMGELPGFIGGEQGVVSEKEVKGEAKETIEKKDEPDEGTQQAPAPETPVINESKDSEDKKMTKIKFVHPMPSFVWKDMKVYGPFDEGEETEIYPEVAELIVRKGRAVKV